MSMWNSVMKFFSWGNNPNAEPSGEQIQEFMDAVKEGDVSKVDSMLISHPILINKQDADGKNAAEYATESDSPEMSKLIWDSSEKFNNSHPMPGDEGDRSQEDIGGKEMPSGDSHDNPPVDTKKDLSGMQKDLGGDQHDHTGGDSGDA